MGWWGKLGQVNEKIATQNTQLGEQEKEIAKIQEFGEFALIGALILYYVGSALTHDIYQLRGTYQGNNMVSCNICVLNYCADKGQGPKKRIRSREFGGGGCACFLCISGSPS